MGLTIAGFGLERFMALCTMAIFAEAQPCKGTFLLTEQSGYWKKVQFQMIYRFVTTALVAIIQSV